MKYKSGFGLIEVMLAAVVLGFLVVALTQLQLGNRESILRIRARDAAKIIAEHVLDSISSAGVKSLSGAGGEGIKAGCPDPLAKGLIYCNPNYIYHFEGKPQADKKTAGIPVETKYTVEVVISDADTTIKISDNTTKFTKAKNNSANDTLSQAAKATVTWLHKNAPQSIKMERTVR